MTPNNQPETQVTRREIHQGKVIQVVQDDILTAYNTPAIRDVVLHPGGVCVLPILPNGEWILIRQFRYATQEFLWEFPAGKLDVIGEAPLITAQRELWEETGYISTQWESYGFVYTAPGFCDERIHLFIAKHCQVSEEAPPQVEDEAIEVSYFTQAQVEKMIRSHEIRDAKTLALYTHYI